MGYQLPTSTGFSPWIFWSIKSSSALQDGCFFLENSLHAPQGLASVFQGQLTDALKLAVKVGTELTEDCYIPQQKT